MAAQFVAGSMGGAVLGVGTGFSVAGVIDAVSSKNTSLTLRVTLLTGAVFCAIGSAYTGLGIYEGMYGLLGNMPHLLSAADLHLSGGLITLVVAGILFFATS